MELERVAAVIRPRRSWEAIDLGLTLLQAWWRQILPAWLVLVLPLWLAVYLVTRDHPYVAMLALWWLRPLFDTVPLYVGSRVLFGEQPRLRQTLAAVPRLALKVAPAYLLLERLDPARSFHLPVKVLEGLSGGARYRRQSVLNRGGHLEAVALTFSGSWLEIFLSLGLFTLIYILVPENLAPPWDYYSDLYFSLSPTGSEESGPPLAYHLMWGAISFVAFTLVELFYVLGGFTLYLNRRTALEGWDVEIALKRLARRVREEQRSHPAARTGRRVTAVLLALALLGAPGWRVATAQEIAAAPVAGTVAPPSEPVPAASPPSPAQAAIEKVLSDPDFGSKREVRGWKWRFERAGSSSGAGEGLGLLFGGLSAVLEGALWLLVGLTLAVLLFWWARHRGRWAEESAADGTSLPELLSRSGVEPAAASLPADVVGAALRLADQGQLVEALSLLYRGAILRLARRQDLELDASWTEGECLRGLARRLSAEPATALSQLTRAWQDAAYAHRPPSRQQIAVLADLYRSSIAPS